MPLAKVLHITDDWKQLKSPIYWAWHAETTVGSHCLGSAIWLPMGQLLPSKFVTSFCGLVSLWGWSYHFRDVDMKT